VPVGATDLALWLEADRLSTLAEHLTQDSVDTQRDVVTEEKRQRYDNVPYGDAMSELVQLVFGADHPYGHTTIGAMEDLAKATRDAAAAFFTAHYHPANAVLTLVGDISAKDAFRKAEHFFGHIKAPQHLPRREPVSLPPLTGIPRSARTAQVPAEVSYFAWRLPTRDTPEFDAADLALGIIGQGQTAWLHQHLVKTGIAAAAGAQAMGLIGGNSIGLLQLRAFPDQPVGPAVSAAIEQLDRLAHAGPTEAELARAKAQFQREWLTELARFDTRADLISSYAVLHRDADRINRRLAEVDAVSVADIRQVAATVLAPDQRAQLDYYRQDEHA